MFFLSQAVAKLKDANRGSWILVRVYNKDEKFDTLQGQHRRMMSKLPSKERTPFVPPMGSIAEKTGYIVFKDSKVVIFYSNDLAETPQEPMLESNDARAVTCVHGLAKLFRWTGDQLLHRKIFMVPAVIVAYNKFMNGVDRMDQYRSTNATQRKEKRVSMTLFTLFLDLAVSQAFAIYNRLASDDKDIAQNVKFSDFKRKICESLVLPQLNYKEKKHGVEVTLRTQVLSESQTPRTPAVSATRKPSSSGSVRSQRVRTVTPATGHIKQQPGVTINDLSENGPFSLIGETLIANPVLSQHILLENKPRKNSLEKPQDIYCNLCRLLGYRMKTIHSCVACKKGFHVNCFAAFHNPELVRGSDKSLLEIGFANMAKERIVPGSLYAATIDDISLFVSKSRKLQATSKEQPQKKEKG